MAIQSQPIIIPIPVPVSIPQEIYNVAYNNVPTRSKKHDPDISHHSRTHPPPRIHGKHFNPLFPQDLCLLHGHHVDCGFRSPVVCDVQVVEWIGWVGGYGDAAEAAGEVDDAWG